MAGDWIKVRVWLCRDPKVIRMADYLAEQREFMDWLTDPVRQTCSETAYECVTRNVTVALCVTGLTVTWGTAREHGNRMGDDLVLRCCDLAAVSAIADIPCFGAAMASVGWAKEVENDSVSFPNFFKENESPDDRHRRQNAERQAKFRDSKAPETRNVTVTQDRNVTVTHREEKRREEYLKPNYVVGQTPPDVVSLAETKNKKLVEQAIEVIDFLNAKTGRHYKPVAANVRSIVARQKEGATLRELRAVVARKCREWGTDEKMERYLRPATLFNATNFAQYVGEVPPEGVSDAQVS